MTTLELAEYYANLLILQYRFKTRARATIEGIVLPILMDQMPIAVQDAFNIDDAVGKQLDVIGKYVGVTRFGYANGVAVELDDDDYRKLIKMVIIKNNSGSSLATIQDLLLRNFPGAIRVTDSQNMQLSYLVEESYWSPDLLEVMINGGYLPKPMGVGISVVTTPDFDIMYFGFRTYDVAPPGISPFNSYDFVNPESPWLTYED